MAPRYDIEGGKVKRRLAVKDVLLVVFVLGGMVLTIRARSSAFAEMARSSKLVAEHAVALSRAEDRRLDETTRIRAECEAAAGETATLHQAALDAMEETMKARVEASAQEARRARSELEGLAKKYNESKREWSASTTTLTGKCEARVKKVASLERSLNVKLKTCHALLKTAEYNLDTAKAQRDLAQKQSQKIESAAAQLADTVHDVAAKIEPASPLQQQLRERVFTTPVYDPLPPATGLSSPVVAPKKPIQPDPPMPNSVLPKISPSDDGMDDDDSLRPQGTDDRQQGQAVHFKHAPRVDD